MVDEDRSVDDQQQEQSDANLSVGEVEEV